MMAVCLATVPLIFLVCVSADLGNNKLSEFCAGHPGIPGSPGNNGMAGTPGRDGREGRDGFPGANGEKGDQGERGYTGPAGTPGNVGMRGERGEKGVKGESLVTYHSAFSAKRADASSFPPTDQPVLFDTVTQNEQGHYSPLTGKFTCAVPGVYYFVVHATVYRISLQFDIMKNGQSVASFFQFYGNWTKPVSLSGGSLVHLEPEDQVWVQVAVPDFSGMYASPKTDSTFTGFLVYSDWHSPAFLG
ncbi:complement C1q tumor necrosis factor-related protein 5 [Callorhinchus milii]|uniref:C1q and TNF related 5 n=1 Tax=Callorhinchus milii TaxID=7868 RepID=V9L6C2_CALMI|nr:complement C1q tumor necrosis factor-related protein 5 [Callorhinchus milii]|eukprot:gi/632989147/ref/XP_007883492.1/ PREDICTED: complement C1q tumor necrosis factor-related protein 5 [Callorhinchus milii]